MHIVYEQSLQKSESYEKRTQFYNHIRSRSKQTLMKKMRLDHIKKQIDEVTTSLISSTQVTINQSQLTLLMKLIKMESTFAIVHLANLFIDGILEESAFQALDGLQYIDNYYFEWSLWVLLQKGYHPSSLEIVTKMFNNLHPNLPQFRQLYIFKSLNALSRRLYPLFLQLFYSQQSEIDIQLIKSVIGSSNCSENVLKQIWSLLGRIFAENDEDKLLGMIERFEKGYFVDLLHNGLLSVSCRIKALSCQIFHNVFVIFSHFSETEVIKGLMERLLMVVVDGKEKNSVKVEISYVLVTFAELSSDEELLWAIFKGYVKIVKQLMGSTLQQISGNAKNIVSILMHRLQHSSYEHSSYEHSSYEHSSYELSSLLHCELSSLQCCLMNQQ